MFERLIHADWSTSDAKKWMAVAERTSQGWQVAAPQRVPSASEFMDCWLFDGRRVLAGFDFPIGLPAAFGRKTGFKSFSEALAAFGTGEWMEFFQVAAIPEEISVRRPFYPRSASPGSRREDLRLALGMESTDQLFRQCDRKTSIRRAACPIFWTLGANQVGKAAISGWQTVIQPSVRRGARLWPFNVPLAELSRSGRCVLCETYPGEAYSHIGELFPGVRSKRRQEDRLCAGLQMAAYAEKHGILLTMDARKELSEGFGASEGGEDPFDALVGLLSMIAVVEGVDARGEAWPCTEDALVWEGWILGQRIDW